MRKNNLLLIAIVIVAIISVYLIASDDNDSDSSQNKIKVATTIYPVYDIVKNISGDLAEVINIMPAGASPHTFELTPKKVKDLQGTDILFTIGYGIDEWTSSLAESIGEINTVSVDNNISLLHFSDSHEDEHQEDEDNNFDPHYWLSVENAQIIAGNITNELKITDPSNAEQYEKNFNSYSIVLSKLLKESQEKLENISNNRLITTHNSWQYFSNEFDLEIVDTFQPSPGMEPTPQELADLHNSVSEYGVKALFIEPQLSQDIVDPFADDVNLPIYVIDPLGGLDNRQSYIELIKYNVDTIYQALK